MPKPYLVNHGGLMRCCLMTLHEHMAATDIDPKEGDTLHCRYCDNGGMIFCHGGWGWNQPAVLGGGRAWD